MACLARGSYTDLSGVVRCLTCHRRIRECTGTTPPDPGPIAGIDYDVPGLTDEDPVKYTTEAGEEIDDASDDLDW